MLTTVVNSHSFFGVSVFIDLLVPGRKVWRYQMGN